MMTRHHFETIAWTMHLCRPRSGELAQWHNACDMLADMCALENPNFDRGKFMRACEGR